MVLVFLQSNYFIKRVVQLVEKQLVILIMNFENISQRIPRYKGKIVMVVSNCRCNYVSYFEDQI